MTVIWHTVMERFSATSLTLQKVEIDLLNAVKLCDDSLITFRFEIGTDYETGKKAKSYVEAAPLILEHYCTFMPLAIVFLVPDVCAL